MQNIIQNWEGHLGISAKLKNIVKRLIYSSSNQALSELVLDENEKERSA